VPTDVCKAVNILANAQLELFKKVNQRVAALRRLAYLLEQLGDVTFYMPNLDQLLPLAQINLNTYRQLQLACPFLNLPNLSALDQLKSAISNAYSQLYSKLYNSPYNRLGGIQKRLDDALSALTQRRLMWDYLNWLSCAQFAACDFPQGMAAELTRARELFQQQVEVFKTPLQPNASELKLEVTYEVQGDPGTSITYGGQTYYPGDTFTGKSQYRTFSSAGAQVFTRPYVTTDAQRQKLAAVKETLNWLKSNTLF
jgi:hypothetical protein